jgi:hypothetical protein
MLGKVVWAHQELNELAAITDIVVRHSSCGAFLLPPSSDLLHASTSIHLIATASWLNLVQVANMKTLWAFTGKMSPLRRLECSTSTSLMGFRLQ